ncbi:MAG TPA: hypothetical protein VLG37_03745 [Candidatus Saccharimonadales bacterium]|nr:hypothetical protein [Candidatus Saccharimonadales bacterium]
MTKRLSSLLVAGVAALGLLFTPLPVAAASWNPFGGVDCSQAADSAVCKDKTTTNPLVGSDGLLVKVTHIIAIVAGAAAVIMILIGAFRLITSGSDISNNSRTDEDVKNARNTIANALIGLAIIVLAQTIISFVLSKI